MKGKENIVLAAVQAYGPALKHASEDMKARESIVLAAVQNPGMALQHASEHMKTTEHIVLAAVEKHGQALKFASEDMKNEERVVLASMLTECLQVYSGFKYASEEMKNKIQKAASKFDIDVHAYARASLKPLLVQVQVQAKSCAQDLILTCHNMHGDLLSKVTLLPEDDKHMLRQKIADAINPVHGPASLKFVVPTGQLLDIDDFVRVLYNLIRFDPSHTICILCEALRVDS